MALTARHSRPGRRQAGFAYIAVLLAIAVLGVGQAAIGMVWHTASQREREQELLFIGEQFRKAIQQFYESSPGERRFPKSLDELLLDPRFPGTRRYLRQLYRDPMTNQPTWGLVFAPKGGIMGVYSTAPGRPMKQGGFAKNQAAFEGKASYSEWQFAYSPVN